ncbi:unnamed protein product [Psylliodes chrysocephalus]|uniref:Uncharacterized protein n=1 Tax=Psylliodes chrysocephalus TaxID=3402493 RepID=A0A9P0DAV8_9CUCU|nr:unnamed protein product [Psylliodes chrysocephala]
MDVKLKVGTYFAWTKDMLQLESLLTNKNKNNPMKWQVRQLIQCLLQYCHHCYMCVQIDKKIIKQYETKEARTLSITKLERLVLLKQLHVLNLKKAKFDKELNKDHVLREG